MTDLFLGVDIGTASTKAVLATSAGQIVASAARSHAMSLPRPGWAEMDAEAVWWRDVVDLCLELTGRVESTRIRGVTCSGLGPCIVPCDDEIRPLRPALLYGIDMRATREIEELTEEFGADAIVARGGSALSTQAVGPKMAWIRRHEPSVWRRTKRWYSASSFVVARLTGEYVLDHHTASQCDPLYDMTAQSWAHDWAERVAPGLAMPRLAWANEVVGEVSREAAAATGLPAGTPVTAGTVDAWAEAFSAGVRRPGDLMLMYGSTMFFVQVLREYRTQRKLWTTKGVEPGVTTLAAGMSTSGTLTEWVRDLAGGVSFDDLLRDAKAAPPGSDGLVMLPYFAGERTPIFDAQARGLIIGLTLRHGRGHILRAAYEGIAFGIRQILDHLSAGEPIERLFAIGGGTQSALWLQIVSDITGRDQIVPAQTIGASYGDALLAAIATGSVDSRAEGWFETARVVRPDPVQAAVYDELFDLYAGLYPANVEAMHQLAAMQEKQSDGGSPA
jgi:xylulokinase